MIFPAEFGTPDNDVLRLLAAGPTGFSMSEPNRPDRAGLQIDLGPGLQIGRFTPGRFANAIQKNNNARHALQMIREDTTSSFVLNLETDGSATACRGWRYLFFNDGPETHSTEHIREQLGYRGRWEHRGAWLHVDIKRDDAVCPSVGQYTHLIPHHSPEWRLRCLPIEPSGHPLLITPTLACRPINVEPVFGEDEPHVVAGIIPGRWIVLGAGNGLKIKVASNSVNGDEVPIVRVEFSPEPVRTNAWEHSF